MTRISFDSSAGAWLADLSLRQKEGSSNDEQLARLSRNLRLAREEALTPRQKQMVELYYDHGMTMGQIALKLNVNRSTVSRTLTRARGRLYRSLRFSL